MILFKKQPCRTCLVQPACNKSCKLFEAYLFKNNYRILFYEKICKILCSIFIGLSAPVTKLFYNVETIKSFPEFLPFLFIIFLIGTLTTIISIFIFKYIRKKFYTCVKSRMSDLTKDSLFPEFRESILQRWPR